MGAKLTIYNDIAARLTAQVPAIKTIRKWNNQFSSEGVENAFAYPACFIGFSNMAYNRASVGAFNVNIGVPEQKGTYTITIYLGFEKYQNETEAFALYEPILQDVWAALQGYTATGATEYGPLQRLAEREDNNHNNVIVWEIDFETGVTDCPILGEMVDAGPVKLQVNNNVIIDPATVNDIRTAADFEAEN